MHRASASMAGGRDMMTPELWRSVKPQLIETAAAMPSAFTLVGTGSKSGMLPEPWREPWSLPLHDSPLLSFSPDDQVAVVWASAKVSQVQEALKPSGLCLPLPSSGCSWVDGRPGSIGGLFACNLPHGYTARFGSPRDWLLGGAFLLADGKVAKAGSTAVKSVAGYDVHRLFCGSRGTLMTMALAFIKLAPIKGLPPLSTIIQPCLDADAVYIQRVFRSAFAKCRQKSRSLIASDEDSSTLWHGTEPSRIDHDWLMGPAGLISTDLQPRHLIQRAKQVFDPEHRFNPHIQL